VLVFVQNQLATGLGIHGPDPGFQNKLRIGTCWVTARNADVDGLVSREFGKHRCEQPPRVYRQRRPFTTQNFCRRAGRGNVNVQSADKVGAACPHRSLLNWKTFAFRDCCRRAEPRRSFQPAAPD
jgi:hypothetical protein